MTEKGILAEFSDLMTEDIRACLVFAADRERKLAPLSGSVNGFHPVRGDMFIGRGARSLRLRSEERNRPGVVTSS
jgi:hypothetical protein